MLCPVEVGVGVGVSPVSAVGTVSDSADATLTDNTDANGPAKDIDSTTTIVMTSTLVRRDLANGRIMVFA